jgi:hypothetical protein
VTGVGVLFIALGVLLSLCLTFVLRSPTCILLFACHLGAAFFNWQYSLEQPADAQGYFAQTADFVRLAPGTGFVGWFVATIRDALGASYLDMFMIFHLFGYLGVVLFFRLCLRAVGELNEAPWVLRALPYILAFLPGFHVWTSVMGKDELVFLGIVVFLWGLIRPGARFLALAAGLALCFLVRPHVAALLAAACVIGAIVSSDLPLLARVLLAGGFSVGLIVALPFLTSFVGLEGLNTEAASEVVETWQGRNLDGGSSLDISQYSFAYQGFTFLFRPLFFDATSSLGLIVSLENLVLLGVCLWGLPSLWRALWASPETFFLRFNFTFWALSTAVLAPVTANLGIALRQKIMVLPSLLLVLLAGRALHAASLRPPDPEEGEVPG